MGMVCRKSEIIDVSKICSLLALAERDSKNANVFFFFVGPSRKGGKLPGVPNGDRGNWFVTTFIVCKWALWWACGLSSAVNEMTHVSWKRFRCLAMTKFSPNRDPWLSCNYARVNTPSRMGRYSRGVLRRYVSQNIVAITVTLRLNRFTLL